MTTETLSPAASFAAERVRAGARRDAIKEQLLAVGWSDEEADSAYAQACVACGVPAREGGEAGATARFATVQVVVNFFSFILLGFIIFGLFSLFFGIIELAFPDIPGGIGNIDVASVSSYEQEAAASGIRYAIAALIIAFPLYWLAMRMWFQRFRANPTAHEARMTKAITYLVLLVAAVVMVGDLITVIYTFLAGDLTIRFVLKALTVIAIAGMTFGFYYLERREVQYRRPVGQRAFRAMGASVIAITLIGIIMGFFVGGSPANARATAFDKQRASDLSSTAQCIENFAQQYKRLPASLAELHSNGAGYCSGGTSGKDPETGAPYAYRMLGITVNEKTLVTEGQYELCATFATNTVGLQGDYEAPWSEHPIGYACDTQVVSVDNRP